jgi:hypothetical protein
MNRSRVVIGVLTVAAILSLILFDRTRVGDEQVQAFAGDELAKRPDFAADQVATRPAYLPLVRRGRAYLPDLVVGDVFNTWCPEFENQCSCVPEPRPAKLMACVENQGPAVAGTFFVAINNTMLRVASLGAGQNVCIEDGPEAFEAEVYVDAQDQVRESREDNNAFSGPIPLPTPLPTCTPGQ